LPSLFVADLDANPHPFSDTVRLGKFHVHGSRRAYM
jgi:hypothetical protein